MPKMIPVSEAKAHLTELVRDAVDGDITLLRHGRPVAYIVSVENQNALLERLEDAEDKLALYQRDGVTMDFEKLKTELGLD